MTRPIPAALAALREDLDLRGARGRPTATARLVLVLLMLHANERMEAWPSIATLAKLTNTQETAVSKALRLLAERGAIERVPPSSRGAPSLVWRIKPATQAGDLEQCRFHCFWPGPQAGRDGRRTAALQALVRAAHNRTHVAAIVMLYQFARTPTIDDLAEDHPARGPRPPNQAWIARVLSTSALTVRRAKRECIAWGLATQHERGLLVFADPARWPAILGCPELAPRDPAPLEPPRVITLDAVRSEAANDSRYSC